MTQGPTMYVRANPEALMILKALSEADSLSSSELARETDLPIGVVKGATRKLLDRGAILRTGWYPLPRGDRLRKFYINPYFMNIVKREIANEAE